jgi:hypothetical protein
MAMGLSSSAGDQWIVATAIAMTSRTSLARDFPADVRSVQIH